MSIDTQSAANWSAPRRDFLAGGGEMGARIRAFDWAATPLGSPEAWPQSLKTIVRVMLDSRYAMWMLWGPEFTFFCNDAYLPTVGIKRDWVLGARADIVWEEIWSEVGPRIDQVLDGGEATWDEGLLLFLERSGFTEETYHTFSYSPVSDDENRIAGMLCVVTEVTDRVIGERRLHVLRDLAARSAATASTEEACRRVCDVFADYAYDIGFAALYMIDAHTQQAQRFGAIESLAILPPTLALQENNLPWPLAALLATEDVQEVALAATGIHIAGSAWSDPIERALLLPLKGAGQEGLAGFLIIGASPRQPLNDSYRAFLNLAAGQVGAALADAQAHETERKRLQALAELDRAKTAFFSNVSHEFRTPLTLMLGPVEEILTAVDTPPQIRAQLELAHRNSLRLLKLVNSLLDFSRIEAGRELAFYEPTDLSAFTRDLASTFRSAIERAGLVFDVDCAGIDQPVYIDREMWEKIVLNLLSNAFKFTLHGYIAVRLRVENNRAVFEVVDTGVGVPAAELPKLFERFHRVEKTQGRTHEGSGIGLALVHELIKLHGATIAVSSELDVGTRFRIEIPFGNEHLPAERVSSAQAFTSTPHSVPHNAQTFVEEAVRWLPDAEAETPARLQSAAPRSKLDRRFEATFGSRIVLADDNADMRAYVRDLLAPFYEVECVADGAQALLAARARHPDLVLSDVMMPQLDGFGLLNALRADDELRDVPIILLSARAGEDARIEGLDAGADDYLAKPFSARELLARVGALLELTQMRGENEERLHLALSSIQDQFYVLDNEWRYTLVNPRVIALSGRTENELLGQSIFDLYPDLRDTVFAAELVATAQTRTPRRFEIFYEPWGLWMESSTYPAAEGVAVLVTDISERKRAQEAFRLRTAQYETLLTAAPLGVYLIDADFKVREVNPIARAVFGDIDELVGRDFEQVIQILWPPAYATELVYRFRHTLATGEPYFTQEVVEERRDREVTEYYEWQVHRIPLPDGRNGVVCYFRDIAAQIHARSALLEQQHRLETADRQKDKFLAMLAHELRNPLAPIRNASELLTRLVPADSTAQPAIGMIKRQISQMTRWVDDLLDVSRITQGRIELKLANVDVAQVITQAMETVEPLLLDKQQKVALTSSYQQPLRVHGDFARLVQCVVNLLTNAIKYTDAGGEIGIHTRAEAGTATIEVADNGVGITPELLPLVFDLFVQSDRTLDRSQGGLGIGLSVVKGLIEMHEGEIIAHSAGLDRGSTFTIRLPLVERVQAATSRMLATKTAPKRILIVDDNIDAANSLAALLALDGHTTQAAYDGHHALAALTTFVAEVALLDIGLPEMNGYELAAKIRELPGLAQIRLIALTGYGQAEDRERAFTAGFDAHLVKPVDFSALRQTIDTQSIK
ncbi:MAG: Multi-sensor hybrid histidine kinase [Verrucomicrobiaceae bacterium]|nr:Multi-sensor hybrid histidine kinase [Verrucomicrobiaceae bacterium]